MSEPDKSSNTHVSMQATDRIWDIIVFIYRRHRIYSSPSKGSVYIADKVRCCRAEVLSSIEYVLI